MNPTTAALVAALAEAIRFAEDVYGDANVHLANRVTKPWCQALKAARIAVTPPGEGAEPDQAIKFHLDQAVDLAAEGWQHALAVSDLAGVDVGDVLDSIHMLADSNTEQARHLPDDQVAALIASWHGTARRRRSAKRL